MSADPRTALLSYQILFFTRRLSPKTSATLSASPACETVLKNYTRLIYPLGRLHIQPRDWNNLP